MYMMRRRTLVGTALGLVAGAISANNGYPAKPLRMIVPWSAGGGTDGLARLLGEALGHTLGQPVIVDNRPGANGVLGTDAVARSAPDGYTFLFTDIFSHVTNPLLIRKLPYDIERDFSAVTEFNNSPLLLVAHPSFPAKSLSELLTAARANPKSISYGSFGTGSPSHLAGEQLNVQAGIDMAHVPYKGTAGLITDLLANHVPLGLAGFSSAGELVKRGALRALAMTGRKRSAYMPEVPRIAETLGLEDFDVSVTIGTWLPSKTSPEILSRLNSAIVDTILATGFRQKLQAIRSPSDTIGNRPEEMTANVIDTSRRMQKLVRAARLTPES